MSCSRRERMNTTGPRKRSLFLRAIPVMCAIAIVIADLLGIPASWNNQAAVALLLIASVLCILNVAVELIQKAAGFALIYAVLAIVLFCWAYDIMKTYGMNFG